MLPESCPQGLAAAGSCGSWGLLGWYLLSPAQAGVSWAGIWSLLPELGSPGLALEKPVSRLDLILQLIC